MRIIYIILYFKWLYFIGSQKSVISNLPTGRQGRKQPNTEYRLQNALLYLVFSTIFFLIQGFAYSQDVPDGYYEPYKQIIEKQTISYGYALYNFTPVLFSRFTDDPSNSEVKDEIKYKEKMLFGWGNRSIEIYQFWAFKKTKGFDFAFISSSKNYNLFDSVAASGEIPSVKFEKTETSLEIGWTGFKKPPGLNNTASPFGAGIAISINKSYFYTLDNKDIVKKTIDLGPYIGLKLKFGIASTNYIKARFGFQEYFYVKYCANGLTIETSTPVKFLNMGGGFRFYRMSKSIRTIGIAYTYFDVRADYQLFLYDVTNSSKSYFSIPLYFGFGLSW